MKCPFCDHVETKNTTHWHSIEAINEWMQKNMIPKSTIVEKIQALDEIRRDKSLSDNTISCSSFAVEVLKELLE